MFSVSPAYLLLSVQYHRVLHYVLIMRGMRDFANCFAIVPCFARLELDHHVCANA